MDPAGYAGAAGPVRDGRLMRPWWLVVWAAVALLVGCGCLFGLPGVGVAALVEAVLSAGWAWLLVTRSVDGSA